MAKLKIKTKKISTHIASEHVDLIQLAVKAGGFNSISSFLVSSAVKEAKRLLIDEASFAKIVLNDKPIYEMISKHYESDSDSDSESDYETEE